MKNPKAVLWNVAFHAPGVMLGFIPQILTYFIYKNWYERNFEQYVAARTANFYEAAPEHPVRRQIETMAQASGAKLRHVFIAAAACERFGAYNFHTRNKQIAIFFSEDLLQRPNGKNLLKGVASHELAHAEIQDARDRVQTLATVACYATGILAAAALPVFGIGWGTAMTAASLSAGAIPLSIAAARGKARCAEFKIDHRAAEIFGTPSELVAALNLKSKVRQESLLSRIFNDHPPTEDRIAALNRDFGPSTQLKSLKP